MRPKTVLSILVLILSGCSDSNNGNEKTESPATHQKAQGSKIMFNENTVQIDHLILTQDQDNTATTPKSSKSKVAGEALPEQATHALLSQLPPKNVNQAAAAPTFAWRDGPKPPTEAETYVSRLNSEQGAPTKEDINEPLTVTKVTPQGRVGDTNRLTIIFSQPMFALGQRPQGKPEYVHITPETEGQFNWLDAYTLQFEAQPGFAPGMNYVVALEETLTSQHGNALTSKQIFTFQTPPANATSMWPVDQTTAMQPPLMVNFDAPIDRHSALEHLSIHSANNPTAKKEHALRLATREECENDSLMRQYEYDTPQAVFVIPQNPLNKGQTYVLEVKPGIVTPGGDVPSESTSTYTFSVHGDLTLNASTCGYHGNASHDPFTAGDDNNGSCHPHDPFIFTFSNPLKDIDSEQVRITPEMENLRVSLRGDTLHLYGDKQPDTRYDVELTGIEDIFEQKYNEPLTRTFITDEHRYWGEHLLAKDFAVIPKNRPSKWAFASTQQSEVHVTIYRVTPKDFERFIGYAQTFYDNHEGYFQLSTYNITKQTKAPGQQVFKKTLHVDDPKKFHMHTLDLSEAFGGDTGHAVIEITAGQVRENSTKTEGRLVWVQKTNIGLSAFSEFESVVTMATELTSGKAIQGVEIEEQKTDVTGTATITPKKTASILVATKGDDSAVLPWQGRSTYSSPRSSRFIWYIADDRNLYRPNEEVAIKGWLRMYHPDNHGHITMASVDKLYWRLKDAMGNDIGEAQPLALSEHGGFDFRFTLPKDMPLGHTMIEIGRTPKQTDYHHYIRVEEFRKPEFEVAVSANNGPHIVGGTLELNVEAKYFAGGALAAAPVNWNLQARRGFYTPPNRRDYFFGQQEHWWKRHPFGRNVFPDTSFQGETNSQGKHTLQLGMKDILDHSTTSLSVEASVMDVNRQSFSDASSVLVHPSSLLVGTRTKSRFYRQGEKVAVEAVVTNIDGDLIEERDIQIRVAHLGGQELDTCPVRSQSSAVICELGPYGSGLYEISALVEDEQGRKHQSRQFIWVAGGVSPGISSEPDTITVITEDKPLREGDEFKAMLHSPFAPAQLLVNIEREGIIETQVMHLEEPTQLIAFTLDERHSPGFVLHGHVVSYDQDKPVYAQVNHHVQVYPSSRSLDVAVTPSTNETSPGAQVSIDVDVTANEKALADAEVALFVVDEAVLATAGYRIPEALGLFYQNPGAYVQTDELREHIDIAPEPELEGDRFMDAEMALSAPAPLSAKLKRTRAGKQESEAGEVSVRQNFSSLATFAPRLMTDANGKATTTFTLPDSLTRYRITAVVADRHHRFGYGESNMTARLPLMARPMPPRFSHVSDQFELPIVIQNLTDQAQEVRIAVRTENLTVTTPGQKAVVPANDRVEIRFPARTDKPGKASGEFIIASDDFRDAVRFEFPVWTPLAQENEAIYGQLDDGAVRYPLAFPESSVPNYGGVEVSASSTALSNVTDAYEYLLRYPFDCSEQLASKVIAISQLGEILNDFGVAPETADARKEWVAKSVKALAQRQTSEGGFSLWSGRPHLYTSIHVMHALSLADQAGYDVPDQVRRNGLEFLRNINKHVPEHYSESAEHLVRAYTLYVRSQYNDDDASGKAQDLLTEVQKSKTGLFETYAWLLASIESEATRNLILEHFDNHIDQTASSAHLANADTRDGYTHMASSRRADAIALLAMIQRAPDGVFVDKLMQGLMDARKHGRWLNTQENAFVALAMKAYYDAFEQSIPEFASSIWVGDKFAGSLTFSGREFTKRAIDIPEPHVPKKVTDIIVSKEGSGRMYYRVGLEYALTNTRQGARSEGFSIERHYEAVDPSDTDSVVLKDGQWYVKAGALVRVKVAMKVPGRRHYVAMVDPLPAGFEAVNPALANSPGAHYNYWFNHQNLHDERVEAFANTLWGGEYAYEYIARATTPGNFVVPPARIEEMYHPETFGYSASDRVVIGD